MNPDNYNKLLVGDPEWQYDQQTNGPLKMSKLLPLESLYVLGYIEKSN